jgi:hypothetical protein
MTAMMRGGPGKQPPPYAAGSTRSGGDDRLAGHSKIYGFTDLRIYEFLSALDTIRQFVDP